MDRPLPLIFEEAGVRKKTSLSPRGMSGSTWNKWRVGQRSIWHREGPLRTRFLFSATYLVARGLVLIGKWSRQRGDESEGSDGQNYRRIAGSH